jgi:hypothetical protein
MWKTVKKELYFKKKRFIHLALNLSEDCRKTLLSFDIIIYTYNYIIIHTSMMFRAKFDQKLVHN